MGMGRWGAIERAESIAARQHGVLHAEQLRRCGLSPDQVRWMARSLRLERLLPSVYRCAGAPETWEQRVKAASLWLGRRGAISRRAAARLHGFAGATSELVELSTPENLSLRAEWVHLHRVKHLEVFDVMIRRGVRVTTPSRTLVDFAAVTDMAGLEAALNDVLRRRLTSVEKLRARLDELGRAGRGGAGRLEWLLNQRLPREKAPESPLEDRVFALLLSARRVIPRPVPQHPVRDRTGQFVARVDFAWVEERIALEVDSVAFHSAPSELTHDARRGNALHRLGWIVVRITAQMLDRPESFLSDLADLLRSRGNGGRAPSPRRSA